MTQLAFELTDGLPQFVVRESPRARRVRLVVSAREGLVVVVPRGFPQAKIGAIVESKRAWAERALEAVAERRELFARGAEAMLPAEVVLASTGEVFPVLRVPTRAGSVRAVESASGVELHGCVEDAEACLGALNRWLDRVAKERLLPLAHAVAERHGFEVASVRVRKQRSRWGSCSGRGTISLNRTLVFLPPELVTAVTLHELVHLRELNHSPAFWTRLASLDPDAFENRERLKGAGDFVPPWADA
ncbi:MAG: M48 family metallopeptidase [Coriobacteriales bacterium]|nr:M48 family metallopeptidase [Coriobacteriales bacterium]